MNDLTNAGTARDGTAATGGVLYRLVWKWHFLASLYVLPFMVMLGVTGGVYLYKPQIEAALYHDLLVVEATGQPLSIDAQLAGFEAMVAPKRLREVQIGEDPTASTRVEFDDAAGTRSYGYVNPYTGEVLGLQARDDMIMRQVQTFHGELLLGDIGTKFVELSAHWAVVMFVTGAILWWPRGRSKTIVTPHGSGRTWWRSTHLFTGMLATVLVVPILITGLPWTDVWGGALDRVQTATGQSSVSLKWGGAVPKSTPDADGPVGLDQAIATARSEGIAAPWLLRPARGEDGSVWVGSASTDRRDQSELVIDQYSGAVLARVDFADNPPVAKAVSWGISFHRGEAYGWLNLAQKTLAAALSVMLAVSGFVAWWMRRPAGSLGVPAAPEARLGWPMAALTLGLMVLFPLMGASLLLALALDWLLFKRLGWFQGQRSVPAE
ncbi:sulfite reductase [Jannaschia pagri]|uniref:Sulfite reductase n=1 Tax=Jannaschia pagri TaxID=2829797 RepID=A0ABQ4NJ13_9RHOB|nr:MULTISPECIES: PepSY domain-containing protein [unclassified Jannaschia]GIT90570.1 sulfite reductase [Jannaschia sp. AI_61]GIT94402.1 sulfite reductase [Jannaschia sp. AI_62]